MKYFVSISGGLDSTALAIICSKDKEKNWKYIFADTGDEFPQVQNHLNRMESILDIKIIRLKDSISLGEYERQEKFFPSPKKRFCTRIFKIELMEKYFEKYKLFKLGIGLRADEQRKGNSESYAIYPLQELNINKNKVLQICKEQNLIPQYPWYMSRGGCYSCFFKSRQELLALARYEPDLFKELIDREESIQDKRKNYYTMFDKFTFKHYPVLPLRKIYEIANSFEQIEIFENKSTYDIDQECGVFCRK
jgi:3'-phosphoadenosine 5'-phosphosulfate sulfotransferase (PAPS reductase)/FAD synthetase